ncbi:MAG: imidazolonepropionase, partial [Thermoplasmata archaeon HGW-Thermoplasmata-1]
MQADLLIVNAGELVTLAGSGKPRTGSEMRELGIIRDGALIVKDGRIAAVGTSVELGGVKAARTIDARGMVVMPGFVDPHAHLVYGGSREFELDLKLQGKNYLEILEAGGGIRYTVGCTRKAKKNELKEQARLRLDKFLLHGTTTLEAKSGYGLDTATELKMLKAASELENEHPLDIIHTFLGAHAIPEDFKGRTNEFVDLVIDEMIPAVAKQGIAEFCDVFCEKEVFDVEQSRRILEAGKRHGLIPKLHADEIVHLGGAGLAADVGAISADHLLMASDEDLKKMADAGTVGVLLPGTPFALMMKEYANARKMIGLGVPVALATDLNPNCWTESMQFMIQLACFNMKMTPGEAITAATINAAHAIGRAGEVGSIEVGKKADILILDCPNHLFIPYHFGVNHVETVIKGGKVVVEEG